MKTMKYLLVAVFVFLAACKKKDKEDPKPEPQVVDADTLHPVKEYDEVKLYIPQNKDVMDYKFFNLLTGEFSSDVESVIHLAWYFTDDQVGEKHVLGSSKNASVRGFHGINPTNQTEVTFYEINDGHTSVLFDTIQDERSIKKIFNTQATISATTGAIKSDAFGWERGKIIGFKIASNGALGLLKLVADPVESYDADNEIGDGRLVFDVKMQQKK